MITLDNTEPLRMCNISGISFLPTLWAATYLFLCTKDDSLCAQSLLGKAYDPFVTQFAWLPCNLSSMIGSRKGTFLYYLYMLSFTYYLFFPL